MTDPQVIIVSACLIGLPTRYDGNTKPDFACLKRLTGSVCIPVCPEQLGGLSTPRCPANLIGGDGAAVLNGQASVVCTDGTDVTAQFINGANLVLTIARRQPPLSIYLKARSPSCGVGRLGVTAALLARHGYQIEEFG